MSQTTQNYFKLPKLLLRTCGVSFEEEENTVYRIFSKIFLACVLMYPILAFGDLFKHDFDTVAECVSYEFLVVFALIKCLTLILNRKKIMEVLSTLDQDLNSVKYGCENGTVRKLLKKCAFITAVQNYVYWSITLLCYTVSVASTLSKRIRSSDYRDWQFTYGSFTVLNVTYSPNYEISWTYQVACVFPLALYYTTTDLLVAAVLCHICFHLKILQESLRNLLKNNDNRVEEVDLESMDWKSLNLSLQGMIKYHLKIIDVMELVNKSFSVLLFSVFVGTLGTLSFMVYRASLIPLDYVHMLRSFVELSIAIQQAMLICFWCEEILYEGKQVGYAAYEIDFVGTDIRFQKGLLLIMIRSQHPITVTAGYVSLSLTALIWILRSSYSAFMVLRNQHLKID